jgi:hypothetical protein
MPINGYSFFRLVPRSDSPEHVGTSGTAWLEQ